MGGSPPVSPTHPRLPVIEQVFLFSGSVPLYPLCPLPGLSLLSILLTPTLPSVGRLPKRPVQDNCCPRDKFGVPQCASTALASAILFTYLRAPNINEDPEDWEPAFFFFFHLAQGYVGCSGDEYKKG